MRAEELGPATGASSSLLSDMTSIGRASFVFFRICSGASFRVMTSVSASSPLERTSTYAGREGREDEGVPALPLPAPKRAGNACSVLTEPTLGRLEVLPRDPREVEPRCTESGTLCTDVGRRGTTDPDPDAEEDDAAGPDPVL